MLPEAPTDNLYKFVTFLGIALLAFCVWLYVSYSREINLRYVSARVQEELFSGKLDRITKEINSYKSMSDAEITANITSMRDRVKELDLQNQAQIKEFGELAVPLSVSAYEQDAFESDRWFLFAGMLLGVLMSSCGITSWYLLHQRYQDAVLREQARLKRD